jgi:hypothetical protein
MRFMSRRPTMEVGLSTTKFATRRAIYRTQSSPGKLFAIMAGNVPTIATFFF